jgi:hypothetical protein
MAIVSIDTSPLHSAETTYYLDTADRRIVTGFRMALELIGVAVPVAALRKPAGRPSIASVRAAYNADNPDAALADQRLALTYKGPAKPDEIDTRTDDILNHI